MLSSTSDAAAQLALMTLNAKRLQNPAAIPQDQLIGIVSLQVQPLRKFLRRDNQ